MQVSATVRIRFRLCKAHPTYLRVGSARRAACKCSLGNVKLVRSAGTTQVFICRDPAAKILKYVCQQGCHALKVSQTVGNILYTRDTWHTGRKIPNSGELATCGLFEVEEGIEVLNRSSLDTCIFPDVCHHLEFIHAETLEQLRLAEAWHVDKGLLEIVPVSLGSKPHGNGERRTRHVLSGLQILCDKSWFTRVDEHEGSGLAQVWGNFPGSPDGAVLVLW